MRLSTVSPALLLTARVCAGRSSEAGPGPPRGATRAFDTETATITVFACGRDVCGQRPCLLLCEDLRVCVDRGVQKATRRRQGMCFSVEQLRWTGWAPDRFAVSPSSASRSLISPHHCLISSLSCRLCPRFLACLFVASCFSRVNSFNPRLVAYCFLWMLPAVVS